MGTGNDDELLNEFLAESREHLAGIEADLLTIEEQGAASDETLVNKVFRAAHSIKGGSAFFGLTKIQELAHKTETALSLIRSREMTPNPEVVNILLQAFDKLREMVNDPAHSQQADISEQAVALTGLSASFLPQDQKQSLTTVSDASFGGGRVRVTIPAIDLLRAREGGRYAFLLRFDLINDVERAGKTPLSVIDELISVGEIIDARLQLDAVGTLDDDPSRGVPLDIVLVDRPEAGHGRRDRGDGLHRGRPRLPDGRGRSGGEPNGPAAQTDPGAGRARRGAGRSPSRRSPRPSRLPPSSRSTPPRWRLHPRRSQPVPRRPSRHPLSMQGKAPCGSAWRSSKPS